MTYALWRLLVICVAAAAGETIAYQLELYNEVMWVGLLFGAATYILTQDLIVRVPEGEGAVRSGTGAGGGSTTMTNVRAG